MKIISVILLASLSQAQAGSVPEKAAGMAGKRFGEFKGQAKPALAVPVAFEAHHKDQELVKELSLIENKGPVEHLINVSLAPFGGISWYFSKLHLGKNYIGRPMVEHKKETAESTMAWIGLLTGIGFAVMACAAAISLITNFAYFWAELFGGNKN